LHDLWLILLLLYSLLLSIPVTTTHMIMKKRGRKMIREKKEEPIYNGNINY